MLEERERIFHDFHVMSGNALETVFLSGEGRKTQQKWKRSVRDEHSGNAFLLGDFFRFYQLEYLWHESS